MAPYYIKSKRGKNLLVNKGHLYCRHSKKKTSVYWVCIRKPECITRCTTTEESLRILKEGGHGHAPDPEAIAARSAVEAIKDAGVQAPERAPVHIIDQQMHRLSDGVVAKLPLRPAMKRAVNRARSSRLPANPKSIRDLRDLPPEFRNTLSGDLFVVYDSYGEQDGSDDEDDVEDTIIVFATKENLKKLGRSSSWFTDGTFMVCPSLFTQLFTIHGLVEDVALPLVYALLPNKAETSHTKGAGLQAAYSDPDNRELKDGVHMLLSLAFVPVEDLPTAFDELREVLVDDLLDIADTFEKTYIQFYNDEKFSRKYLDKTWIFQHGSGVPYQWANGYWRCQRSKKRLEEPGALLVYHSKLKPKPGSDYRGDMNSSIFSTYYRKKVIQNVQEQSVFFMDNASYRKFQGGVLIKTLYLQISSQRMFYVAMGKSYF
ncbi:hypothetical protein FOCC_FOCC013530 [Frankliniella occidentalis]|nr:hypothetical protein FOCC_FOCC013530 [Frankliniella occidentalis]